MNKIFDNDIGVLGQAIGVVLDGFSMIRETIENYLIDAGIGKKDEKNNLVLNQNEWYSANAFIRVFQRIADEVGESGLFNVGRGVPEKAVFPPWVKDLESGMKAIDIAYHMNHSKNGIPMFNPDTGVMLEGIGHYNYRKAGGENKIIIECTNYYPCLFDKGIIFAMAAKFNSAASVGHDDLKPCRQKGGESCTYNVIW